VVRAHARSLGACLAGWCDMVTCEHRRQLAGVVAAVVCLLSGLLVFVGPPATAKAATAPVDTATEVASPAVSSLSPGRVDVFTRWSTGALLHQYLPVGGSWTAVRDLGGTIASRPSVVSWGAGPVRRVRARHKRHAGAPLVHQHRWLVRKGEPGRQPAVRSLGSDPGRGHAARLQPRQRRRTLVPVLCQGHRVVRVAARRRCAQRITVGRRVGPGRLDVFVRASDGSLRDTWFTGSWARFENLGGTLTAQPAAVSVGFGRLDVAVRATDNSMRVKSYARGVGLVAVQQ